MDCTGVRRPASRREAATPASSPTLDGNFPPEVAGYYDFPAPASPGSAQTIALYESDLDIYLPDVEHYFSTYINQARPSVTAATGSFTGGRSGQNTEAMLDIEIAGSVAFGANIVVYAASQYGSMLQAVVAAVDDGFDVMSISYGGPESTWHPDDRTAFNAAFLLGGYLGMTFCVSSGDSGAPGNQAGKVAWPSTPRAPAAPRRYGPRWWRSSTPNWAPTSAS